jgi:hypothetical protein
MNRFHRILGAVTAAGAGANAETSGNIINRYFFDKSYREGRGWNDTKP